MIIESLVDAWHDVPLAGKYFLGMLVLSMLYALIKKLVKVAIMIAILLALFVVIRVLGQQIGF